MNKAYDLKIYNEDGSEKAFIFSVSNFDEAVRLAKGFLDSGWKKTRTKAEWKRSAPDSVFGGDSLEIAKIMERKWGNTVPKAEQKSYKSNKKIRQKIDRRLSDIASLEAMRGCWGDEEEILKKIAELNKEISILDSEFLNEE
jgi:hypothetical protein